MLQPETFRVRRKFHPRAPKRECPPAEDRRDRGRRAREALRRLPGGPGALLPGAARRGAGPGRAQRRRQDHDHPQHRRASSSPRRGRIRIGGHDLATRPGGGQVARSPSSPTSRTCSTTSRSRSTSGSWAGSTGWRTWTRGSRRCSRSWSWRTKRSALPGRALAGHEAEAGDRLRPAARAHGRCCSTSRSPGSTRSASGA